MLTYPQARALPWPGALSRREPRRVVLGATGKQAVRHGIRGAIQASCLSAAVLAAAGVLGARGPVVLSEPSQPAAVQAVQAGEIAANASPASTMGIAPVAAKVTTR